MSVKSVRIVSNNTCFGTAPTPTTEVEQYLTIAASGQVWFSARNYEQYLDGKGYCRKARRLIGSWKAEYLLNCIERMAVEEFVTDCGSFDVTIRYDDGQKRTKYGSLVGAKVVHGDFSFSLTKLLRRYIPIRSLWGFDGLTSPDYEGKKEIHLFAKRWVDLIAAKNIDKYYFEDHFGIECESLGFQMDCGNEFHKRFPGSFDFDRALSRIIDQVNDVDLLGSSVFSQWRYLTHWSLEFTFDEYERQWFVTALERMMELTKKSKSTKLSSQTN